MLTQEFIEKMKTKLEEEKKKVEAQINELTKPEEGLDNPSDEDLAQDAAEDIVSDSLLKIHRGILEKIDNALYRIKDGTYGRCLLCGAAVSEEALAKEPWAEHCEVCGKK